MDSLLSTNLEILSTLSTKTDNQTEVEGLVADSRYYAKPIDPLTVNLYRNEEDLRLGINTVSITGFGAGTEQSFESVQKKRIVYSVMVSSTGSG